MQVARSMNHMKGNDIRHQIEQARNEMFELASIYGLQHELTVAKSQELDVYLNEDAKQNHYLS